MGWDFGIGSSFFSFLVLLFEFVLVSCFDLKDCRVLFYVFIYIDITTVYTLGNTLDLIERRPDSESTRDQPVSPPPSIIIHNLYHLYPN